MAFSTSTTTGYGQRLGKSLGGVLTGILLFLGGTALLWWNEGNFVKTRAALYEAQDVTQTVQDIGRRDESLNGQLIHATGTAGTGDILEDPDFGIEINAIRLTRSVEYYQWVEEKETSTSESFGGSQTETVTYTYRRQWVGQPVPSAPFADPEARSRHANQTLATLEGRTRQAANVHIGAYRIPEFLVRRIDQGEPLTLNLSAEAARGILQRLLFTPMDASEPVPPDADPPPPVHVSENIFYIGASPAQPAVGDVRVAFTVTRPGTVSLVAKVIGDTFEAYRATNGREISLLSMGAHSLESLFGAAHDSNVFLTWLLRLAGVIAICVGSTLVVAPVKALLNVIPPLAKLVGVLTGVVCVLLGLAWSCLLIALAWLFFRPPIGLAMLAAAAGLVWLVKKLRKPASNQG